MTPEQKSALKKAAYDVCVAKSKEEAARVEHLNALAVWESMWKLVSEE